MKRILGCLLIFGLGACPSVTVNRVNVTAAGADNAPIGDAIVGAICTKPTSSAGVTDASGIAHLEVKTSKPAPSCEVIVAKEGFATKEVQVPCTGKVCETSVRLEVAP